MQECLHSSYGCQDSERAVVLARVEDGVIVRAEYKGTSARLLALALSGASRSLLAP